jgi:hypothetical protein
MMFKINACLDEFSASVVLELLERCSRSLGRGLELLEPLENTNERRQE